MNEDKYTNRLINETSPYLLQHAHNPVDWRTWGEEALQLAKEKDMPILLSIGYSSCHWCHVMEKESFENEKIAGLMNDNFICIKVDREERPDLDEIYMNAVQAMTGSGGWPMTVFLTPELKPFYAGTYFPPTDMYGKPGFTSIVLAVAKFYNEQRDKAESYADQVSAFINDMSEFARSDNPLSKDILKALYNQAVAIYDEDYGGFGSAPKFPQPTLLSFLMRYWKHDNEPKALEMVQRTLKKMAEGGIYDQLGGGFHRYSVDERWLVPHFEKMLYDNALLSRNYLEAYQITGNTFYRKIATETLDYVLREMYEQNKGFYSALDADSEGEEGKYYVWDIDEIKNMLVRNDADVFIKYYGLKTAGNFEHNKNILQVVNPDLNIDDVLMKYKGKLLEYRQKRVKPRLDDKIITSWNALMISSMAFAYQVLGEEKYLNSAKKAAEFILSDLSKDGMLLRTYRNGKGKLKGYADDYAFFINSLIDLYEATFELRWLKEAIRLNDIFISEFWDEENGGFFYTGKSHERLITRTKPIHDGAIPSANSVAMMNLLRLGRIIGNSEFVKKAETTFSLLSDHINQSPSAFTQIICALDFYFSSPREIAIIGKRNEPKVQNALRIIYERYIPNRVIVFYDPDDKVNDIEELIPLLKYRIDNEAILTIYICENNTCKNPIISLDELEKSL